MHLSVTPKVYVFGIHGVGAFVVNFLLNFGVGYMQWAAVANITAQIIRTDALVSILMLPLFTFIIAGTLISKDLIKGVVKTTPRVTIPRFISSSDKFRWFWKIDYPISCVNAFLNHLARAVCFAVFVFAVLFLPTFMVFQSVVSDDEDYTLNHACLIKGVFCGVIGMAVEPCVAYIGISFKHTFDLNGAYNSNNDPDTELLLIQH